MSWAADNLTSSQREREFSDLLARAGRQVLSTSEGGRNLVCRCPLPGHEDRNPSFGYHLDKDVYNCSSCGGGDLVHLHAQIHGLTDTESLKALKAKYLGQDQQRPAPAGRAPRTPAAPVSQPTSPPADLVIPEQDWALARPLPAEWLARLAAKRGWTPEAIAQLDLRLWVNTADHRLPYVEAPGRVAIPVRDDAGKLRNVRMYLPGAAEMKIYSWYNGRKPNKISYGAPARPYPAPATWPASGPLWLVEGEPDCVCAISQGLAACTKTAGVSNRLREMLNHLRGRQVVICYDADLPGIQYALRDADDLRQAGCGVRIILWPAAMISPERETKPEALAKAAKDRQKAGKLADSLGLPPAERERVQAYIEALPSTHGQDLTDAVVVHGYSRADLEAHAAVGLEPSILASQAQGVRGQSDQPPLADDAAAMLALKAYSSLDDKFTYRPLLLARQILEEENILTERSTGQSFRWNGQYWAALQEGDIKNLATRCLGLAASRNRIREAADLLLSLSLLPEGEDMDPMPRFLCMANGMLDLDTWELLPHAPEYRCTHQFPWDFTPDQPPACDMWRSYLWGSVGQPDVIAEMRQFTGYCLWAAYPYHKVLIMVGRGNNGKSVYIDTVKDLLGPGRWAAINMKDLEDQFLRATLHRRWINIFSEASSDFYSTEYFKAISGGDPITASYKFMTPFQMQPTCKHIFSAQELPDVRDRSHGFHRRLLPVAFNRVFKPEEEDPHLRRKLKAELPGIFHWALGGLHLLRKAGGFRHGPTTLALLERYRRESDPLLWFVDERCILAPEESIDNQSLYDAYKTWCGKTNTKAIPYTRFFRALEAAVPGLKRAARQGPRDSRGPRSMAGLCLASEVGAAA